ncbi:MAG: hypothetical protein ACE5GO_10350, partial [Anaerolineales bacterium]
DPKAVLTPHSLANAVAPYVNAIINIQYAINEVRGAPHQKIRILEIQGRPPIVVKLDGAEEVVGMIKEFVIPWRKQNTDRLRHGSARTFQADPGQNTIEQAKIDLATQIIERVSPDISEKDKITCLASLLPPLTALLFSEFELE